MEGNDLARTHSLIDDDDLEFVPVLGGLKQIELNRQLSDLLSDGDEAVAGVPRLRLPSGLEVIEPDRQAVPSFSAFDQTLEVGKALERYRDDECDAQRMQPLGDGFVEECAVDAGLDLCAGKARAHMLHFGDTLLIRTGERAADRGHVRQPFQTENALTTSLTPGREPIIGLDARRPDVLASIYVCESTPETAG